ncbi:hypothetical protein TYRP_020071 [Tyrophagus putrescentiae]|nr:hypothetical protein TYRP_020071 [Tyrophagus putrescentiae]
MHDAFCSNICEVAWFHQFFNWPSLSNCLPKPSLKAKWKSLMSSSMRISSGKPILNSIAFSLSIAFFRVCVSIHSVDFSVW